MPSYSGGTVYIPNVTGNIVITATATAATVSSISAVFNQGQNTIYDTDSLDTLKQYLTVTATYTGGVTSVVTGYTLSGTLTAGTSTITVSYSGKTTTFTVNVTEYLPSGYTPLAYVWSFGNSTTTPIYVNTGVIPTANTSFEYKVSRDTLPVNTGTNTAGHVCSTENFYAPYLRCYQSNNIEVFCNRLGNEVARQDVRSLVAADTPFEISAYVNGNKVFLNGTEVSTVSSGNSSPTKQLTLFTYDGTTNVAQYLFVGKLYYMNIYESGTMIRQYVPCKNSSNVVGLYDRVNESFVSSATSKQLSAPNS